MAARLNRKHQDTVRAKIKANRHVEELQKLVAGQREMTGEQLRAAIFLIEQSIGKPPQSLEADVDGELTLKWKS